MLTRTEIAEIGNKYLLDNDRFDIYGFALEISQIVLKEVGEWLQTKTKDTYLDETGYVWHCDISQRHINTFLRGEIPNKDK